VKRLTLIVTSILLGIGSLAFARITDLTINPDGTVSSDGEKITVSGTVTCTEDHTFSLTARAGQVRSDGQFAVATSGLSPSPPEGCTGSPQAWTVVLSPMSFPILGIPAQGFEPGHARCNVTANDNTDGEAVSQAIDCVLM
jgi:hypothetical protein